MILNCPDCNNEIDIGEAAPVARVECENWAGVAFRVAEKNGVFFLKKMNTVSCPLCRAVIELLEGASAGDIIFHCGQKFRLTLEYGAFALEELAWGSSFPSFALC